MRVARGAHRRGFTLVELLVVIGIIALLISILLPALNKARKASKTVACLSNERQIGNSFMMYFQAYKGHFSPYYVGGHALQWQNQLKRYGQVDAVRLCPEAQDQNPMTAGSNQYGGAFLCWGPSGANLVDPDTGKGTTGSYGFNGYLYVQGTTSNGGNDVSGSAHGHLEWLWTNISKRATEIPLAADCIWENGWPEESDTPNTNLFYHDYGYNMMSRFCLERHYKEINVLFADGHARTVPLADLWLLQWHTGWAPTTAQLQTVRSTLATLK